MLSFEHVSYRYPDAPSQALTDISFSLRPGEYVVLLGSNGSGKSTLAQLTNGLLLPEAGRVRIGDLQTDNRMTIRELRSQVGFVAQNPDNQIVSTTVLDEVAFGPENLGFEREKIRANVTKALEALGLVGFEERDPNSLSGGEKQRLVIAGLLAMDPVFLVLDEPTSMLDAEGRAEVREAIAKLHAQGHGILHITHELHYAHEADRVLALKDGQLVYDGNPAALLSEDNLLVDFGLKADDKGDDKGDGPFCHACENMTKGTVPFVIPSSSLKLQAVHYSYNFNTPEERAVLKGVDLTIDLGSYTLISGSTGSGKSTLLRILAGLLAPTKGQVSFSTGKEIKPGDVGIVFQHPESQLFARSVEEEILFGPNNLGLLSGATKEERAQLVTEALAAVGLDPQAFTQRSPFTLSGGEMRRVAIASVLAMHPSFMLLDEPTAGLDAQGRAFIHRLIAQLQESGAGLVVVSHDIEEFQQRAQDHLTLRDGRLWRL